MLATVFWLLLFIATPLTLAYRGVDLRKSTLTLGALLAAYILLGNPGIIWGTLLLLAFGLLALLNFDEFREEQISSRALAMYRKMLPSMSDTEKAALEAGTVWWDGELFSGKPDWDKFQAIPKPTLSEEEQAFLDGPTEELCRMLNDWEITHELGDLPPNVWDFIKQNGFFAMIIPKRYGGLEFSALAHSAVLKKLSTRSSTAASTIAVPNSLGPGELLLEYGTEDQKDYYLPRLAKGEEIPCFALTGPRAGSDATSLTDSGVVCKGEFEGKEVLGVRLNWNKRYITLAPVATVLGLAFKLDDPEGLLEGDGKSKDYGITCALIPTHLPGIDIGRRHFPINIPFQNGPTQGKDVFVPVDYIIGGPKMAGHGWRMLVENLSIGRSISLPTNATGGSLTAAVTTGAYARIRQQFNMPIGRFEGIIERIARIAGLSYIMDGARKMTAGAIDLGEVPSVPSAIVKYHLTEMGRVCANDAMDVHGGKGIMLGPKNYLARGYQSVPVAITVEGANILTRSMIIFGQGAMRCHPYVLKEIEAANNPDPMQALDDFDRALFGHIGHVIQNAARSFVLAITFARFDKVPVYGPTRRYYQHIDRFCAAFALVADAAMLTLGGALKKKESISARLGDMLSYMYLASATLKHWENQGRPEQDLPLVEWGCRHLLYRAQEQLHGLMRNFPNRWVAAALRVFVFPRGRTYFAPSDRLEGRVAKLLTNVTETRARLSEGLYTTVEPTNPIGLLEEVLPMAIAVEPLERKLRQATRDGKIEEARFDLKVSAAVEAGVLTADEAEQLLAVDKKVMELVDVDDFEPHELGTKAKKPVARKKRATKKKVAKKRSSKTDIKPDLEPDQPSGPI